MSVPGDVAYDRRAGRAGATGPVHSKEAPVDEHDAVERAREVFLDDRHVHGCAEATFIVLKEAFGLPDPADSSAAMALNGGVAYSGGVCGAVTGAAMAIGLLAERRIGDHGMAKCAARELVANLMDGFRQAYGAIDCRELVGLDLGAPGGHDAFIASWIWRDRCLRQVEFSVRALAPLADPAVWAASLGDLERKRG
jgi:C_GCAxxG_C_C family probable redox protein